MRVAAWLLASYRTCNSIVSFTVGNCYSVRVAAWLAASYRVRKHYSFRVVALLVASMFVPVACRVLLRVLNCYSVRVAARLVASYSACVKIVLLRVRNCYSVRVAAWLVAS